MDYKKIIEYIFYFLIFVTSLYILIPLLENLLWAIILSYIFYPLFNFLKTKLNEQVSALITVLIIIFLFISVTGILLLNLIPEIHSLLLQTSKVQKEGILAKFLSKYNIEISEIYKRITYFIFERISSIYKMVLDTFLIFVFSYYFLLKGKVIVEEIKSLLPFKDREILLNKINEITKGVIYGYILGAAAQAIVSYIGFLVLGYKFPLLLSILTFILAILPFVGPWTIWIPLGIYKILVGEIWIGIISILYSLFIVGLIDNLIRPKVLSYTGKIDPLLAFIGMFGGLFALGIIGIFIGPIVLSIFVDIFLRYKELFK